jgi:hypothetical protein
VVVWYSFIFGVLVAGTVAQVGGIMVQVPALVVLLICLRVFRQAHAIMSRPGGRECMLAILVLRVAEELLAETTLTIAMVVAGADTVECSQPIQIHKHQLLLLLEVVVVAEVVELVEVTWAVLVVAQPAKTG